MQRAMCAIQYLPKKAMALPMGKHKSLKKYAKYANKKEGQAMQGIPFFGANSLMVRENFGVADGARTHDNRNHNPGLYQLSYSHRRSKL